MANVKRSKSVLPILAAAASAIPLLAPAVPALSPIGVAHAAMPDDASSLQTLAQAVVRGDDAITPERLRGLILAKQRNFTLIDIRSPDAFGAGHIQGAENVPLPKLFAADEIVRLRRVPQVIVYADTTDQEAQAAMLLRVAGVPALALAGGLDAWVHELAAGAAQARTAAIVRALNDCPQSAATAIPPLTVGAPPAATPARPPAAEPAPMPPKKAPINLKGMCS